MTVDLTSEQEAILQRIASEDGKSAAQVVIETAVWLKRLTEDEAEQKLIERRLAKADRGVMWVSHDEVGRRFGLS